MDRSLDNRVFELAAWTRSHVQTSFFDDSEYITIETLQGACAISSFALMMVLKHYGYDAHFVASIGTNFGHCWVEVDDYVIDITATQFIHIHDYDQIFVIAINEKYHHPFYNYGKTLYDSDAFDDFHTWPPQQSPDSYMTQITRMLQSF